MALHLTLNLGQSFSNHTHLTPTSPKTVIAKPHNVGPNFFTALRSWCRDRRSDGPIYLPGLSILQSALPAPRKLEHSTADRSAARDSQHGMMLDESFPAVPIQWPFCSPLFLPVLWTVLLLLPSIEHSAALLPYGPVLWCGRWGASWLHAGQHQQGRPWHW